MENTSVLKIPILHRTVPYIYVRMEHLTNRYRVSANYQYLNSNYGLKLSLIRDLEKIFNQDNKYFKIKDSQILKETTTDNWQDWNMIHEGNSLLISRLLVQRKDSLTSLIVLNRNFEDDKDSSIFFASDKYFTIDQFLEDSDV